MAMTADGKVATADRQFSRFGSSRDQDHLYRLRNQVDAIMSGATTIDQENATLTRRAGSPSTRLRDEPLRILVTARGSLPLSADLFRLPGPPILVLTTEQIPKKQSDAYEKQASAIHRSPGKEIDWASALAWLRTEWQVERLLCEGGGTLNQTLFQSELVDVLYLTICPTIIGGAAAPTIADGKAFPSLNECSHWQITERQRKGDELFLRLNRFRRKPGNN